MKLTTYLSRDMENNGTAKQYKRDLQRFSDFCRIELKIREVKDLPDGKSGIISLLNAYSDRLSAEGKSAATVHTYLAPVCRGFGVNMKEIDKPKRQAVEVSKSRQADICNSQGQAEKLDPRNARLVDAAERIGIRRAEYARLNGMSYGRDICGQDCVTVRGKGGKIQHQRILPEDREAVKKLFDGSGRKLFSPDEMNNKIDLHGIRREHAQRAYAYYVDQIRQGKGDQLRQELVQTFKAYHYDGDNEKRVSRFLADIDRSGGVYRLRGENTDRARTQGQERQFDRLALMCVSVWHLAHWRLDVTVRHYML